MVFPQLSEGLGRRHPLVVLADDVEISIRLQIQQVAPPPGEAESRRLVGVIAAERP